MSPHSKNPGYLSNFYVYKTVSAKGAAFTASLGQRPRDLGKKNSLALKARFTTDTTSIVIRVTRNRAQQTL